MKFSMTILAAALGLSSARKLSVINDRRHLDSLDKYDTLSGGGCTDQHQQNYDAFWTTAGDYTSSLTACTGYCAYFESRTGYVGFQHWLNRNCNCLFENNKTPPESSLESGPYNDAAGSSVGVYSNGAGTGQVMGALANSVYTCYAYKYFGMSAPTSSPTTSPTMSPTTTPWNITLTSMETNFGVNSDDELTLAYLVGKGRAVQHILYAGNCNPTNLTAITGLDYNVTNTTGAPADGMEPFTLSYSIDKSSIEGSNAWNQNNQTKLELCQVMQLTAEGPSGPVVIIEDFRDITVDFDLGVDFSIDGNVTLAGATINAQQQNTTLADFITAFKCLELGGAANTDALKPNTELGICVKSESEEVDIDKIVSMQIDGKNPDDQASTLPVIENAEPSFSAFTSIAYSTDGGKAIVVTRVPTNLFDFEATNANIAVSGALTVKLADGSRRRLAISKPVRDLQAASADAGNEAAFDLKIDLQPEEDGVDLEEEEGAMMMNAAKGAAGKGFAVLGMILASAYALW